MIEISKYFNLSFLLEIRLNIVKYNNYNLNTFQTNILFGITTIQQHLQTNKCLDLELNNINQSSKQFINLNLTSWLIRKIRQSCPIKVRPRIGVYHESDEKIFYSLDIR